MNSSIRNALLAASVVLVAAGCERPGSSSPEVASIDAPNDTTGQTPVSADDALADYEACLGRLGVNADSYLVEPGSANAITESVQAQIDTECTPILNSVVTDIEFSPDEQAAISDAELDFARCMRANGVDWPDPGSAAAQTLQLDPTLDPATVDAAFAECEPMLAAVFGPISDGGES